jgi:hypothetical protein
MRRHDESVGGAVVLLPGTLRSCCLTQQTVKTVRACSVADSGTALIEKDRVRHPPKLHDAAVVHGADANVDTGRRLSTTELLRWYNLATC